MSTGAPAMCVTTIALVRGVIRAATCSTLVL